MKNISKIIDEIYTEKLEMGLRVCMAVSTDSMYPTILPGSLIEIEKCKEYFEGDVIVIATNKSFIVHRVVKINKNMVVTKGDCSVS